MTRISRTGAAALGLVSALVATEARGYGVDRTDTSDGHGWILLRAIEELEANSEMGELWPLDDYMDEIQAGLWFADNTGTLDCSWTGAGSFDCDAIHHYGRRGEIYSVLGFGAADTGDLAASGYARQLYDLAVAFWPGGDVPSLSSLPYVDGGSISHIFNSVDLGNTHVGGLPFCERWVYELLVAEHMGELHPAILVTEQLMVAGALAEAELHAHPDYCPKWPHWISSDDSTVPLRQRYQTADEGVENALFYLGWALHLLQDITVPHNAGNVGDTGSEEFEDRTEELMADGSIDHLPIHPEAGESYSLGHDPSYPAAIGAAIADASDVEELVENLVSLGLDTFSFYNTSAGGYHLTDSDGQKERIMDAAIRFTAHVIESFFEGLTLGLDSFEDNDTYARAAPLSLGTRHPALSLHTPYDEDYYLVDIPAAGASIDIDVLYDGSVCAIGAVLEGPSSLRFGQATTTGTRITATGLAEATYTLHLYALDDVACRYELEVRSRGLDVEPDWLEDNDSPATAMPLSGGGYDELNIEGPTDPDYYLVDIGSSDEATVELTFEPRSGELQLSGNGAAATAASRSSSSVKTLSLTRSGAADGSGLLLEVAGASPGWYALDISLRHCVVDAVRDCLGTCVAADVATAATGDGICDNGEDGLHLMCSLFGDDHGDCLDLSAEPGSACGSASVYDCAGVCVIEADVEVRTGDGFCDGGERGVDLRCAELGDDHGDCVEPPGHDSCATAAPVAAGSSLAASIGGAGEEDWYRIDVPFTSFLTVRTTGSIDTVGALFGSCGAAPLLQDDDSGADRNFQLTTIGAGSYYLRVTHSPSRGVGDYTLSTFATPIGF